MEKVTYYGETDGVALEQMVRYNKFDMRVKHFHPQYEIFYIVQGERVFFFHNREYIARSGDLILIDSNLIHMTKSREGSQEGHNRVILYIAREKMAEYDQLFPSLQLAHFFRDFYGVYPLDQEQQALFLNLFRTLRHALDTREHNYRTGIDLSIMNWLYTIMGFVRSRKPDSSRFAPVTPRSQIVYSITEYLAENCSQSISLDQLAQRFHLSKSYVCRIFKEVTSYTVCEYINIHRIRKAARYLEETDMSISQIAQELGFESLTYFERIFKTYMTLSPLKYRKTLNTVTYTNQSKPEEPS